MVLQNLWHFAIHNNKCSGSKLEKSVAEMQSNQALIHICMHSFPRSLPTVFSTTSLSFYGERKCNSKMLILLSTTNYGTFGCSSFMLYSNEENLGIINHFIQFRT